MDIQPALDLIRGWAQSRQLLSLDRVKELHRRVLRGSIAEGEGGVLRGQRAGEAERLERELIAWIDDFNAELRDTFRSRDDFLQTLADLHVHFHGISPFRQANGRTNRLLMFFFSLHHQRELLIVHDSYYRIIMNLCREEGSAGYLFKYLKALGDEAERQRLLGELEKLAF